MTGKIINWLGIASLILISVTIYLAFKNLSFISNNNTVVVENKKEIIEIKKVLANRTPYIEKIKDIDKRLDDSIVQDKSTLDMVARGRRERYVAQDLYLAEVKKQQKQVANLENKLQEIKVKLDECIKAR